MNVNLTPDLERLVRERVATGQYNSAAEVIQAALRLLKERDLAFQELQGDIAAGLEQLDRGEEDVLDIPAIKAKARLQMG